MFNEEIRCMINWLEDNWDGSKSSHSRKTRGTSSREASGEQRALREGDHTIDEKRGHSDASQG